MNYIQKNNPELIFVGEDSPNPIIGNRHIYLPGMNTRNQSGTYFTHEMFAVYLNSLRKSKTGKKLKTRSLSNIISAVKYAIHAH